MPRRARIAVANYPHHIVQRGHKSAAAELTIRSTFSIVLAWNEHRFARVLADRRTNEDITYLWPRKRRTSDSR